MGQIIEAPNDDDFEYIAAMISFARDVAKEITGKPLTRQLSDLHIFQEIIESNVIEPESTQTLQALGLAFGQVFIADNPGYDYWMVEDEYGRDPALRYKETTLLSFPQTIISKRIEDGEEININELYTGLVEMLEEVRMEHYSNA